MFRRRRTPRRRGLAGRIRGPGADGGAISYGRIRPAKGPPTDEWSSDKGVKIMVDPMAVLFLLGPRWTTRQKRQYGAIVHLQHTSEQDRRLRPSGERCSFTAARRWMAEAQVVPAKRRVTIPPWHRAWRRPRHNCENRTTLAYGSRRSRGTIFLESERITMERRFFCRCLPTSAQ